ncbi:hypothetical protein R5M92_04235 [Halomonas sp. Bachu 37]|uniref:hypothetical protein n=1 Tax=Halomonas kashgarensis TaxID=3084920 RepID=UPI00321695B1
MATLTLPLKAEYFDAIKAGNKPEEFRLTTPYWRKRLEGRVYDRIELTKGYPKREACWSPHCRTRTARRGPGSLREAPDRAAR